jgi:hypothetical protein
VLNCSSPTAGGNIFAMAKTKSQHGASHHNHFCNLIFNNLYSSPFLTCSYFEKTLLDFYSSGWYQVFGLRKIII